MAKRKKSKPAEEPPKPAADKPANYDQIRERQAAISRNRSASGREIGGVPPIADIERRERCGRSLREFCDTYNPEAFRLPWGDDQLRGATRIEEAIRQGALYAFAEPRGSGKTTRCRMAALFAVAYGFRRYVFVIGANKDKAYDTISAIQMYCRFLPLFAADFPEIAWPAQALGGIANRAAGQTCGGEPTMIEWSKNRIVLPTVPPPENWPKHWPLRADGVVPTAGAIIGGSGLTGEGIRGSLLTLTTGESVRPDLVLLDDPQTDKSARSPRQNESRIRLVSGAVLGMAGPGKAISAVMPCTVIEPGDMADTLLDREQHPLWRGERTSLLTTMPADLDAWDPYFDAYRNGARLDPPDFSDANAYYLEHRDELDRGALASWPARKLPTEASAIQHAMNLYCRDRQAFFSEYQNQPLATKVAKQHRELAPAALLLRLNRVPIGEVPRECTRLTAGVDCSKRLLWFAVVAWDEYFGGSVVRWGAWPDQRRNYFTQADARPSLELQYPGTPTAAALYAGLRDLSADILGGRYLRHQTQEPITMELALTDSGWETDTVMKWIRETPHAGLVLPSKGYAASATSRSVDEWARKPNERAGDGWRLGAEASAGRGRRVAFDADKWKSFLADRLTIAPGARGCLMLPGDRESAQKLLADHLAAEVAVPVEARGRRWDHWIAKPGNPDNHLFDCLVMAAVAASVRGLSWNPSGGIDNHANTPQRRKLSEIQASKRPNR
jgi:hypothetical protein